jgi:glycosyltransferase involved in cell wall biosynthesis
VKIVHITPHLPPDQAANALLPAQLGQWMAQRGDEVAFVAHEAGQIGPAAQGPRPKPEGDLGPEAWGPGPGLPVRWIPRRRGASATERLLKIDAWRLVRQVHAALNDVASHADLLHFHSNGLIVEAAAAWAHRRSTPYVLTLYGTEIWHYQRRWPVDPFTRAYVRAARVTFYSQRLLERARDLGLDREGLSVIYPPVAEAFRPFGDAARTHYRQALGLHERFLVLNVKRLHPLAGQRFLIEAFARVHAARKDVQLVICGDGAEREALAQQVASLGLAGRVTLAGLVPNEIVAQYMAAADVFALPSLLEALPTVAVEALASGTPVISADHPGGLELQGVFGDDVTVVPRESVDPLARAMSEFLDSPRRAHQATAQRIERLFRPPAVMDAFDRVYAEARRNVG